MPTDWSSVPDVQLESELHDFQNTEQRRLSTAREFPPTPAMIDRMKVRDREKFVHAATRIAREAGAHDAAIADVLAAADREGVSLSSLPTFVDELKQRKGHWFDSHVRPRNGDGTFGTWAGLSDADFHRNLREKFDVREVTL